MQIQETKQYKYLGDIITNDGKNSGNIDSRQKKLRATTISINTIASGEVLNRIESAVLLELHEKINLSSLLYNAESWNSGKCEEERLEKIEIRAIKDLFNLPVHTPTTAIIYTFGLIHTKQRVDLKILQYLHRILLRNDDNWTKKALETIKNANIGWFHLILTASKVTQ